MKKFFLFAISVLAFTVVSCHDDDTVFAVRNMQKSDCKVTQSAAPLQMRANGLLAEPEAITLTATGNGYLKFLHENAIYGCDCEQVNYKAVINDRQILLIEDAGESFVNCVCTIDCSCEVGPLTDGDYTLTVADRNGTQIASIDFTYSASLAMVVPVQEMK